MKKCKDNLNTWRNLPCSGVGRLNVVEDTIVPKLTYRLNTIRIKISASLCEDTDKLILKLT